MKIILTELHVGACSTVAALTINNKDLAGDFLCALVNKDIKKFQTTFSTITETKHYSNEHKFRNCKNGIYEIKISGKRLYCFKDTSGDFKSITNSENHLILVCSGGIKNTKREQDRDIGKAKNLKMGYFQAKEKEYTELEYKKFEK